jgi:hypothetical protein
MPSVLTVPCAEVSNPEYLHVAMPPTQNMLARRWILLLPPSISR